MNQYNLTSEEWEKVFEDVDWIVNAILTSYTTVKNDQSNMFQLSSTNRKYIDAVIDELEHYGIKIVSNPYNGFIGVEK